MKKLLMIGAIFISSSIFAFACTAYPTCHSDGRVHGCHGGGMCDSMSEELGD